MTALEQTLWLQGLGFQVLNVVRPGSALQQKLMDLKAPRIEAKNLWSASKVRREVIAFGPDLIVHQQLRDLTYHKLFFPSSIPSVGFLHMFLKVKKKDPWHRFHYSCLNRLIVLTDAQKQNALGHLPLWPEQIEIIPNGVDTEKFHPRNKDLEFKIRLGWEPSTFLVGVVGRFDPQKGQMEALEALRYLRPRFPQLRLLFVGEDTINSPGTEARMKDYINKHSLNDVARILPFQRDIATLMASLDLFLMPSYGETFGRVLIEAMASGSAVMGTRAGGVVSLIDDGRDGLLIAPRSSQALQEALEDCLRGKFDLKLLAERARQTAINRFDSKKIQGEILSVYRRAAKQIS